MVPVAPVVAEAGALTAMLPAAVEPSTQVNKVKLEAVNPGGTPFELPRPPQARVRGSTRSSTTPRPPDASKRQGPISARRSTMSGRPRIAVDSKPRISLRLRNTPLIHSERSFR
jgi:hypothetical protein